MTINILVKKAFAVLVLLFVALTNPASADTTVVLFGSSNYSELSIDGFTSTQTATTYEIVGNDMGPSCYGTLMPSVNITGSDLLQLKLTASFSGDATSKFQVRLYDSNFNYRQYQGDFTSFTQQNVQTAINLSFFSQNGAFNNTVTYFGLLTAGNLGSHIDLTMKQVAFTVPEPSSYAFCVIGLVISVPLIRRRRLSPSR